MRRQAKYVQLVHEQKGFAIFNTALVVSSYQHKFILFYVKCYRLC